MKKFVLAVTVAVALVFGPTSTSAQDQTDCSKPSHPVDRIACLAGQDGDYTSCPTQNKTTEGIARELGSMLDAKESEATWGIMSLTVGEKTSRGVWVLMPWDDHPSAWFMHIRGTNGGFFRDKESPEIITLAGRNDSGKVTYRPAPPKTTVPSPGLLPTEEFTDPNNLDFRLDVGRWHVVIIGSKSRNISSAETEIFQTLRQKLGAYAKKNGAKYSLSLERCGEATFTVPETGGK